MSKGTEFYDRERYDRERTSYGLLRYGKTSWDVWFFYDQKKVHCIGERMSYSQAEIIARRMNKESHYKMMAGSEIVERKEIDEKVNSLSENNRPKEWIGI